MSVRFCAQLTQWPPANPFCPAFFHSSADWRSTITVAYLPAAEHNSVWHTACKDLCEPSLNFCCYQIRQFPFIVIWVTRGPCLRSVGAFETCAFVAAGQEALTQSDSLLPSGTRGLFSQLEIIFCMQIDHSMVENPKASCQHQFSYTNVSSVVRSTEAMGYYTPVIWEGRAQVWEPNGTDFLKGWEGKEINPMR